MFTVILILHFVQQSQFMSTVTVTRTIPAPIEAVFQRLTEHAQYSDFSGISESTLLQTGTVHRDGVGAVRKIKAGYIKFTEAITEYTEPEAGRPGYMAYLIKQTNLPIKHQGGRMEFVSTQTVAGGAATQVIWKTTFTCNIPVVGKQVAKYMLYPQTEKMFGSMLKQAEKILTGT